MINQVLVSKYRTIGENMNFVTWKEFIELKEAVGQPHELGPETDDWRKEPLTSAGMTKYQRNKAKGDEGATNLQGYTPKREPDKAGGYYSVPPTVKKRVATDNKRLTKRVYNTAAGVN